jgi:hypothetical protein
LTYVQRQYNIKPTSVQHQNSTFDVCTISNQPVYSRCCTLVVLMLYWRVTDVKSTVLMLYTGWYNVVLTLYRRQKYCVDAVHWLVWCCIDVVFTLCKDVGLTSKKNSYPTKNKRICNVRIWRLKNILNFLC